MKQNLLIAVLGNRNAGKSYTWNSLFNATVRTGSQLRPLYLTATQYVEVFLVSASPEERELYVEDIMAGNNPRIVLCSLQYYPHVTQSIQYFVQHDYFLFIHWLNPGFHDPQPITDHLNLIPTILSEDSTLGIRNARGAQTIESER